MDNWALHRLLIDHEGRRTHPYRDSVGKITIGVGRNLTDRGLSGGEIDLLLANDIALARTIVTQLFGQDISAISTRRYHALLSMAFNLGGPRLSKFIKMRGAIALGDWDSAALHALDSRWARQTGRRADHIAAMMRAV